MKHITVQTKIKRHFKLSTNGVKSGINKKVRHVNKKIQYEELESINVTTTWDKELDKHKETYNAYDINCKEKALITCENKYK